MERSCTYAGVTISGLDDWDFAILRLIRNNDGQMTESQAIHQLHKMRSGSLLRRWKNEADDWQRRIIQLRGGSIGGRCSCYVRVIGEIPNGIYIWVPEFNCSTLSPYIEEKFPIDKPKSFGRHLFITQMGRDILRLWSALDQWERHERTGLTFLRDQLLEW